MKIFAYALIGALILQPMVVKPVAALPPVMTVHTDLTATTGKSFSMRQVEQALSKCSAHRGWTFSKASNGQLIGKLIVRGKHYVEVGVQYNSKEFQITYRDSKNMKYDAASNTIHKRYNSWVENLSNDVVFCLQNQ